MNCHLVELEEMTKTHTAKSEGSVRYQRAWHGMDVNFDISMGTLDRSTLMGRDGSRLLDCVPCPSKQVKDFLAATKLGLAPFVASHLVSHSMGGALEQRAASWVVPHTVHPA
jgi:hypothetical protein